VWPNADGRTPFCDYRRCTEAAANIVKGLGRSVDGNYTTLFEVEGANIIESHDVIGMRVCEQNRIDAFDTSAQGLLAEIRRGIDENAVILELDVNGRTEPLVARIIRAANGAMTAYCGHTYAGARTEHRDAERFHGHLRVGLSFGLGRL
jgi:hypothetical protein